MSAPRRPAPACCRHEPPYPAHRTVLFVATAPDLCAHTAGLYGCPHSGPHPIEECAAFMITSPLK